jgi:hypothetical protein
MFAGVSATIFSFLNTVRCMAPTATNVYLAPEAEISLNLACLFGTPPCLFVIRPCLDHKFSPKFHYEKENSPSHQNAGTYMEY